jgi:hypothetical protein
VTSASALGEGLDGNRPKTRCLPLGANAILRRGTNVAQIFVSYSKPDRALAERIVAALRLEGFSVWWDDDLHPRTIWDQMIETELDAAETVIVLWTADSIRSDWVKSEADFALQSDPPKLIQVRIGGCRVPLGFNRKQYLDLDSPSPATGAGWARLLKWLRNSIRPVAVPAKKPAARKSVSKPLSEPEQPKPRTRALRSSEAGKPPPLVEASAYRETERPALPPGKMPETISAPEEQAGPRRGWWQRTFDESPPQNEPSKPIEPQQPIAATHPEINDVQSHSHRRRGWWQRTFGDDSVPEENSFVTLISPGPRLDEVIKVVQKYTVLDRIAAKALVERAPPTLLARTTRFKAHEMGAELLALGARASIRTLL